MWAPHRFAAVSLFTSLFLVESLSLIRQVPTTRQWRRSDLIKTARHAPFVFGVSPKNQSELPHQPCSAPPQQKGPLAFLRTTTSRWWSPVDTKEPSTSPKRTNQKRPSSWKQRLGLGLAIVLTATLLVGVKPALASTLISQPTRSVAAATTTTTSVSLAPMLSRLDELRLMGRLWYAALLGAAVGKERSTANHHPAGVRTLALVSLGSAAFTLVSMYGFGAAGRFDTSRMASAVASGIGFIGAGVITTTTSRNESIVHGLTTASAVWISAAMGVTCGSGLYILATSLACATLGFLRIGGNVKHKRSQYRRDTIAHMVETDPELLRKLIDWEKVNLPDLTKKTDSENPKRTVQIERFEDKNDECLISKRYFPQDQEAFKSSHQEDGDSSDVLFYDGDEDDELIVMSTPRGGYGNETEDYFGDQKDIDEGSTRIRRPKRYGYDDDVAP